MLIKTIQTINNVKILHIKESIHSSKDTKHKHIFYGLYNGTWLELSDKNLIFKSIDELLNDIKTSKPLSDVKLDWLFKYYLPNAIEI